MSKGSNDYETESQAPSSVVPHDPDEDEVEDIVDYLSTEIGFVQGALDYDKLGQFSPTGEWEWELKQLDHIEHDDWWIANKCRQFGISTDFSVKAFARGILTPNNYNAIFVSYKRDESQNKINYVRQFLEALPPTFKKDIVRDPLQLIEWENNNGTRAKIISHAQRPIRGINGDVFLDELAFYQFDEEIYKSAMPAVGGARGALEITSTPFGADGKFWEIFTTPDEFPQFKRETIYWWECLRYLKHPDDVDFELPKNPEPIDVLIHAEKYAADMDLEERVMTYGNQILQMQYRNADTDEDFMQEFEGFFVDSKAAFFTKEMTISCMFKDNRAQIKDYEVEEADFNIDVQEAMVDFDQPVEIKYPEIDFQTYQTKDSLLAACLSGKISRNLYAGVDIGSGSGHPTSIFVLEEVVLQEGGTLQVERYQEDIQDKTLPEQQEYLIEFFKKNRFIKNIKMDTTAIGHQMGQKLKKEFNSRFEAVHLGGSSKKIRRLMNNLHGRMEGGGLALAFDRKTINDLYSIKRKQTANKNYKFTADDKKSSHADRGYALALASLAGTEWNTDPMSFRADNGTSLQDIRQTTMNHKTGKPSGEHIAKNMKRLSQQGLNMKEQQAFLDVANPGTFIEDYDV